jgi:hypothetical protein
VSATDHDDRHSVLRTLALTDEVIGLRAELAELRHRLELQGVATTAPDDQETDGPENPTAATVAALTAEVAQQRARADQAEAALASVLASASWRIGQAVVGAGRRLRHR